MAYLDDTGLAYFWGKIKAWANSVFALIGHTHASSGVTAMTGYSMPSSTGAISSGDTLNQAVGKLEKAITAADISNVVHITGTETITGSKQFTTSPRIVSDGAAYRIDPPSLDLSVSGAIYRWLVVLRDMYERRIGGLYFKRLAAGDTVVSLLKMDAADTDNVSVDVGYDSNGIAYASAPSTSSSRNGSNDIVTRDWIPNDVRIVHTTGNETVSGTKTLTDALAMLNSNFYLKKTAVTRNVAPSEQKTFAPLNVQDSADNMMMRLYMWYDTDKYVDGALLVYKGTSTDNTYAGLHVGFDADGLPFAFCPSTRSDRSKGEDIVTRDWIPNDTRIVHTTGTENIAGRKNFTGGVADVEEYPQFIWKSTAIARGDTLSSEYNNWPFYCIDKNNYKVGGIHFRKYTSGSNKFELICYNPNAAESAEDYASLAVAYSYDGIPYAMAPSTRSDRSEGGDIVTRNWIPNDTRIVHTTGAETVDGIKTFSSNPVVNNSAPKYSFKHSSYNHTSASSTGDMVSYFADKNGTSVGSMGFRASSGSITVLEFHVAKRNATSYASICLRYDADNKQYFFPQETNSIGNVQLGSSSHRWGQLFTTASPNVDSDERLKQQIAPVPDEVLDAWGSVGFCQFKFNASVEAKGDAARLHSGLVAQRVDEAFSAAGLDARAYGLFCWDGWEAEPENGVEAGEEYSLRYEEALCMEAAYMRRENARLKARVASLEDRLAALELRLGSE